MYRLSYIHTSENINKQSLHVRRKEKIGLSHAFLFAYLHLFVREKELVDASSFFSLLILITGDVRCMCNMQKTLLIGSFILFFACFLLR
jgi:hypothetical protein